MAPFKADNIRLACWLENLSWQRVLLNALPPSLVPFSCFPLMLLMYRHCAATAIPNGGLRALSQDFHPMLTSMQAANLKHYEARFNQYLMGCLAGRLSFRDHFAVVDLNRRPSATMGEPRLYKFIRFGAMDVNSRASGPEIGLPGRNFGRERRPRSRAYLGGPPGATRTHREVFLEPYFVVFWVASGVPRGPGFRALGVDSGTWFPGSRGRFRAPGRGFCGDLNPQNNGK